MSLFVARRHRGVLGRHRGVYLEGELLEGRRLQRRLVHHVSARQQEGAQLALVVDGAHAVLRATQWV